MVVFPVLDLCDNRTSQRTVREIPTFTLDISEYEVFSKLYRITNMIHIPYYLVYEVPGFLI